MSRSVKGAETLWERYGTVSSSCSNVLQIEYVDLNSAKVGRVKLGVQQRLDSMFELAL